MNPKFKVGDKVRFTQKSPIPDTSISFDHAMRLIPKGSFVIREVRENFRDRGYNVYSAPAYGGFYPHFREVDLVLDKPLKITWL